MSRLLFVYGALRPGGIETLIVRVARHLAKQGQPVALCIPGGELVAEIGDDAELLVWTDRKDAVAKAAAWIGYSSEPVTMVSFDPISAALGLAIEARNPRRAPLVHISGVYHPRTYFMVGERRDRALLNRLVAKAIGDPLIFYMNAECRAEHERCWRTSLSSSVIIPLPIEERAARWENAGGERLRIVSVGRLVDFKTYNLSAAQIASELGAAGMPVCWDIYGTGPLHESIRDSIERHDAGQLVALKGTLRYASYAQTVAGYDLFVGMGTAALEAAMLGVPTIVATESEHRRSHGFVYELPFGNVGEQQAAPPPYDLADLIRAFGAMSRDERTALSVRCRAAVLPYSLDHCLAAIDRLANADIAPPRMAFKRLVSRLYEAMTASPAADLARRIKGR